MPNFASLKTPYVYAGCLDDLRIVKYRACFTYPPCSSPSSCDRRPAHQHETIWKPGIQSPQIPSLNWWNHSMHRFPSLHLPPHVPGPSPQHILVRRESAVAFFYNALYILKCNPINLQVRKPRSLLSYPCCGDGYFSGQSGSLIVQ